jgi:alpha-galactosidase
MMHAFTTALLIGAAAANDNGLAMKPPLGWRSWNLYGANVNQSLIQSIMTGMTKKRPVDGVSKSLCDVGFCDVGLDDNWQACGSPNAAPGMHYHDAEGNPIVNTQRFPDMKAMTDFAHNLNLTAGWYGNNCICSDHCKDDTECHAQMKGDVAAFRKFNFDSWKLDGCGAETDLVTFNSYMNTTGRAVMVENCHWGSKYPFKPDRTKPAAEGCPWNFYRSSGDVRASYASILHNLGTTIPLAKDNLSYPGCWAYPDMLQVGCAHGPGGKSDPGLSLPETRTHFGAWAIVSSPLTLSHDVNDEAMTDKIWDVITNAEVLEVNQDYVGNSGTQFGASERTLEFTDAHIEATGAERVTAPSSQMFYKPISGGRTAVLVMNSDSADGPLSFKFSDVPGLSGSKYAVRDIWAHKDMGTMDGSWTGTVPSHDCAFLVLSAATE